MIFQARQFQFRFPRPALVMGILNVTPDSFSDAGQCFDVAASVARGLEMIAQGAEIIDVGGESTRPGAAAVSAEEELRRTIPVVAGLAAQVKIPISIDTMKPEVARAALAAGASMVNNVSAHRQDLAMWREVATYHAGYVVMHAPGSPVTARPEGGYQDVVREVGEFFSERLSALLNESGVAAEQVVLDPGIGFGKTAVENLKLIHGLGSFARRRRPLMLGASRKSFIEKITGAGLNERLPASLACATLAISLGANIIRAHDVAETVQAVRMAEAIIQKSNVE